MKSKSNFLFFVVLVFSAYSCSPKSDGSVSEVIINDNKVYVSDLKNINSTVITLPLSKLMEECALVQLETGDDIMVNPWLTTVTDNYIGIRQSRKPFMLFDRTGKYLRNIGSMGQGPGEYSQTLYDVIIDEKNGFIYFSLFMGDKVLVYTTSGEFIKYINLSNRMIKPKIFLYNNTLTVIQEPFSANKSTAFQYDINTGELLAELTAPSHFFTNTSNTEVFITRNTSMVFDFSLFLVSDTLYHFDANNFKILPFFTLSDNTTEGIAKQYIQLNKDLCLIKLFDKDQRMVATDLKNKSSRFVNIVNDYYGNLPVSANITMFQNGYFVFNIQPEQLMDDINKRLSESSCSEKDRLKLKELLSTLKENTNNVVFIGKLKSEVKAKLW